MKKTYLIPETTLHELIGGEAVMQDSFLPVHNKDDDEEVEEIEDLLSNHGNRLWEEWDSIEDWRLKIEDWKLKIEDWTLPSRDKNQRS